MEITFKMIKNETKTIYKGAIPATLLLIPNKQQRSLKQEKLKQTMRTREDSQKY